MLVLASASPRRRELLQQAGIGFEVVPSHIPETRAAGETPEQYVQRIAADKARHVARFMADRGVVSKPVLAADTEVVLGDTIFGKPRNREQARDMLRALAGRTHTVLTGLCLSQEGKELPALSRSLVTMAPLSAAEIDAYVATGEADDKAGAYAIQGRAASFIERLEGSYSGVMGLPLYDLHQLLKRAGVVV